MLKVGYKIILLHGDCFACDYVKRLIKANHLDSDIVKYMIDSDEGLALKKKYNLKTIPVILVYNNENLVELLTDIEKKDILNIKDKYFIF